MSRKSVLYLVTTAAVFLYAGVALGAYIERNSAPPVESVQLEATSDTHRRPRLSVQGLLEATNAEREKAGIKPLELDERLNASAEMKLERIVSTGSYGHDNGDGTSGNAYIYQKMPECLVSVENLNETGRANISNETLIRVWMESAPHRKAILDERLDYVGFSFDKTYAVQHFCDID